MSVLMVTARPPVLYTLGPRRLHLREWSATPAGGRLLAHAVLNEFGLWECWTRDATTPRIAIDRETAESQLRWIARQP